MSYSELARVAWSALRAHKLRSFLTMLGIIISVWTIVSVVSVISGMNDYVRTKVFSLSPDVFVATRFGMITSREEFIQALKRKPITENEVDRLREACESCGDIGLWLDSSRGVHSGSRRLPDVPLHGTSSNVASLQNLDFEAGRYFTDLEDERRAPVAVIGSEIQEELFPHQDPIGRTIWIGGFPHRIIGALVKQGSVLGQSQDLVVYTPFRTAQKLFGHRQGLDQQVSFLVRSAGGIPTVAHTEEEVVQIFRWMRHVPPQGADPIGLVTAEMVQMLWKSISRSTFVFVIIISSISLLVGAIVVANIMLVSVIERTKEIGLRLALGARKRDIQRQFLVEATFLSLAGGVIGSLAGAGTAWLVETQSPMPARVTAALVMSAMATAGGTGLLAGFFPARKASNLSPIEALRYE